MIADTRKALNLPGGPASGAPHSEDQPSARDSKNPASARAKAGRSEGRVESGRGGAPEKGVSSPHAKERFALLDVSPTSAARSAAQVT